jgi:multidrug resistance efflux pump
MKINILYVFWAIACCGCIWLFQNIFGESESTFFGTAENEGIVLNYEHTVLVKRVLVKSGTMVKKGDTLAIFYRTELDRQQVKMQNEIANAELDIKSVTEDLKNEIRNLESKRNVLRTELTHQQEILFAESGVQRELMNLLDKDKNAVSSNLKSERIRTLREEISALEAQIETQKVGLKQRKSAEEAISIKKIEQSGEELQYLESERKKLVLLAPIDGFIEQVFITENTIEPNLKPLVKINPTRTNRVRGFIYENAEIACSMGDTVQMTSIARPGVWSSGYFISVSPEMVELPVRLRKLPEIKSWGREVYLQLPPENIFYIGEKVSIKLKPKL